LSITSGWVLAGIVLIEISEEAQEPVVLSAAKDPHVQVLPFAALEGVRCAQDDNISEP
jgi:hypothetical protein